MTMMCVFDRMMSQLANVNTQSTVGMFHFHDVLRCSFCTTYTANSICVIFFLFVLFLV